MNLKENLIIFSTLNGEWNSYAKFNALLYKLKKYYKEIVAVVPQSPLCILSEANKYITINNDYLIKNNENYPKVCDVSEERKIPTYLNIFKDYIDKNIDKNKYDILRITPYDIYNFYTGEVFFKDLYSVSDGGYTLSLKRDFNWIYDWIKDGNLLYPSRETFLNINKKYINLFDKDKKNYILITRNFKNNQSRIHNTDYRCPDLYNHILKWIDNDIKIINIGFPPVNYRINHTNYIELFEEITQEELISLFYLSNGVLLGGNAGGYLCNILCNVDVFLFGVGWDEEVLGISTSEARRKNNTSVSTQYIFMDKASNDYQNKYEETTNILKKHNKVSIDSFNIKKEKIIL